MTTRAACRDAGVDRGFAVEATLSLERGRVGRLNAERDEQNREQKMRQLRAYRHTHGLLQSAPQHVFPKVFQIAMFLVAMRVAITMPRRR
jgi:hypothetical protein